MSDAPQVEIDEPRILIRIPELWDPEMSEDELYDATRGHWRWGLAVNVQNWPLPSLVVSSARCS